MTQRDRRLTKVEARLPESPAARDAALDTLCRIWPEITKESFETMSAADLDSAIVEIERSISA